MRVIIKDADGELDQFEEPARFEETGSGQLIVGEVDQGGELTFYNPDEWAWYRVENPEVHNNPTGGNGG